MTEEGRKPPQMSNTEFAWKIAGIAFLSAVSGFLIGKAVFAESVEVGSEEQQTSVPVQEKAGTRTQVPSPEPAPAPVEAPEDTPPPRSTPTATPEPIPEPPELGEPDPVTEKPRFKPRVVESDPTTSELNLKQLERTAPIVGTVMKDGVLHDVYESTVRLDENGQPFKYYFPHRG